MTRTIKVEDALRMMRKMQSGGGGGGSDNYLDWFGKGTSIPDNADLDGYQTTGKFYCLSDARAKTLDNCPTTTNFCLFVFYRTDYISQLIVAATGRIYTRSRTSSAWRSWITSVTTTEFEELTQKTVTLDVTYDDGTTGTLKLYGEVTT